MHMVTQTNADIYTCTYLHSHTSKTKLSQYKSYKQNWGWGRKSPLPPDKSANAEYGTRGQYLEGGEVNEWKQQ